MFILRIGTNNANAGPLSVGKICYFAVKKIGSPLLKCSLQGTDLKYSLLKARDKCKTSVVISICFSVIYLWEARGIWFHKHTLKHRICHCHSVFKSLFHFLTMVSSSLNSYNVTQSWTWLPHKKCYLIERWTDNEHLPAVKSEMVVLRKQM